ncbi:MAG: FG-GAP-like repeat-containing protein, partial [Cyclobacteriaceae bacterium]|nr:FG-GAP-like repeat-containing protein [Cyclobacteriaceae bacterium]
MKWINGWLMWTLSLVLWAFFLEVQGQSFTNVAAARNVDLGGNKDGGLCWADFNNDGFLDLAVNTNDNGFFSKSRLFIWNSGTSLFDDVTATDVNTQFNDRRERSALAGDFDNDGDVDFMRSTSTQLEIYRNTGAPNYNLVLFQEFTSGVAPFNGTTQNGMNNEGLAWMDFDGDGDLDVYMEDHQYGQDILEYDQGIGLFVHYTPDSDPKGFPTTGTSGDYSVTADLDNDGYVDVVARRQGTNTQAPTDIRGYDIFFNDGDGTFSPNTTVNLQTNNSYKGGVAVADFDNDGDFDYMWTNHDDGTGTRSVLVVEQTGFNTRNFQIATVTVTPGGTGTLNALPDEQIEGIAMADINNDGKVDVFLAADSGPSYLLINNNTGGNFSFIHENYGINVNADGEGLAFGDYDDDGDMDFYLNIRNGNNQLWENDLSGNTDYLKIEPLIDLGGGITRAAIGATVVVDEQGCSALKFIQEVSGGVGHGAQNDSRLHFGLPNGPNIRYKITVSFVRPNGGARTVVQKYVTPSALAGQTIQVLDTDTSDPDANPNAVNDSYTVSMNSSNNALDVMDNDSDPNGENLTLSLPSAVTANGGTVTVNNNSTPGDPTDDFIDYTPANGFFGVDNFDYEITNVSLFCSSASVTITVNGQPTSSDNTVSTPEDITYTFTTGDFTVGYSDPEGDAFAEIRITSLESVGNLLYNGNPVTLNQVISAADITGGLLTFVPVGGQSGSPYDSFDFEVGDGTDFSTLDYTLTINVTPVNDPPVGSDNTISTPEDITYTF